MKTSAALTLTLLSLTSLTSLSIFVGCAASTAAEKDVGGGANAIVSRREVTVNRTHVDTIDGKCTTYTNGIEVVAPSAEATKRINDVLAANRVASFNDVDCRVEESSYQSTMTVNLDKEGILSVEETGVAMYEGAPNPVKFVVGHTFDVATGQELEIKDLLTSRGISTAIAACDATMRRKTGSTGSFIGECTSALREDHGTANYGVEAGGLRVHLPSFPDFVLELEGALIPWSALEGALTGTGAVVLRGATE